MSKKIIISGLAAVAVIIIAVVIAAVFLRRGTDMDYSRRISISASEARAMMRTNPDAIILDVRTAQEFATGRIPGAILLPDYAISYRAESMLTDKDALILVYCRSGNRSRSAAYELIEMGYTNVYDFGGIMSWPYETE